MSQRNPLTKSGSKDKVIVGAPPTKFYVPVQQPFLSDRTVLQMLQSQSRLEVQYQSPSNPSKVVIGFSVDSPGSDKSKSSSESPDSDLQNSSPSEESPKLLYDLFEQQDDLYSSAAAQMSSPSVEKHVKQDDSLLDKKSEDMTFGLPEAEDSIADSNLKIKIDIPQRSGRYWSKPKENKDKSVSKYSHKAIKIRPDSHQSKLPQAQSFEPFPVGSVPKTTYVPGKGNRPR